MSIYIHIPYCVDRCGFCDCYSIPLGNRSKTKQQRYVNTLVSEIRAWSRITAVRLRPVTTIHFGGGSPNCLPPTLFKQIVDECRDSFNVLQDTEWAIECTSSLATDSHLTQLNKLGFRRLHIGVQTLDDSLRKQIGRNDSAEKVLARLENTMESGFIISVDIIYGLPGQTGRMLVDTLNPLTAMGIHGTSLYRLNISKRNNSFFNKFEGFKQDARNDYVLFQTADQFLTNRGYEKNHFSHFALAKDKNLYFSHRQRGEDLLSLGATADGLFGNYNYRHPVYSKYLLGGQLTYPILEGGVESSPVEVRCQNAIDQLMGGCVSQATVNALNVGELLDQWVTQLLLMRGTRDGNHTLTANGSWFVSRMIAQLKETVRSTGTL